jgi:hypothetical protein
MSDRADEDLAPYMARMSPVLDATLGRLAATRFRADPLSGARYSRLTSIIGSAYKRHGQILGRAILERLKDSSRFSVWTEDKFALSPASRAALERQLPPIAYRTLALAYGEGERTIPVDLIVHEPAARRIRAYNVTRGNGVYDAGKKRAVVGEALRTQMHLADYARSHGLSIDIAEAYVISYYGLRAAPEPYSLIGNELDDHFGFAIRNAVETVNNTLRRGLHRLVEGARDGPETSS